MHLSIGFLLATFAATVFAAPSSVSLDAHVIVARDKVPSPLLRRELVKPNAPGRLVDGTGDRQGRVVDGTTKGVVPSRIIPSVYYFPDNIIPQNFRDFDTFQISLYFSLKTFIDVVNQWATSSFPPAWVAYQFRKYVHDVYKIMILFQNGCQFCTPNFAPEFQNLAKTMILWIQYALQVIYSKYQMIWVQLADSFQFLKVIVSCLFGLVASFGINLPGWYNNLNLDANIFNAASIPVAKFRDVTIPQLLSTQRHF